MVVPCKRVAAHQDDWIIFRAGYMQHMGHAEQGIPAMAAEFEEVFQKTGRARVELRRWNDDGEDLAEWIYRRCSSTRNVRILAISYSWGVGYGFLRFARSCRRRGIRIAAVVMIDPVAHLGPYFFHLPAGLFLSQIAANWPPPYWPLQRLPRLKIRLPANIDRDHVYCYSQKNGWLRGHQVVWQSDGDPAGQLFLDEFRTHRFMDECPEARDRAFRLAHELFP